MDGPRTYHSSWSWFDWNGFPESGYGLAGLSLGGSIKGTSTCKVTQKLVYVWASGTDGNGNPVPSKPPSDKTKAYFLLRGDAEESTQASIRYWDGVALLPGLFTFHTSVDDGLGDAPVVSGPIYSQGEDGDHVFEHSKSQGSHLVQKDGSSGTVTLSFNVSAHSDATLSAPSEDSSHQWIPFPAGNGATEAHPVQVEVDSRGLTLGTSIATFHKDPNTGLRVPNVPDPDGTLELTSIYSHHASTTGNMGLGGGTATIGEDFINWINFSPSFTGDWHWKSATDSAGNPILAPDVLDPDTWSWSPSESEDTWAFGKWSMPWGNISYQDGQAQGQPTGSQTKSITYNATDNTDGATGTAKANVTLHDEWENAQPDTPATTLHMNRTYAPGNAGVSNNTGVKQTSPPTMTGSINASVTLGFNFSPSFEVGWAKILGIAVNTSGTVGATLSISVPGPLLDPGYAAYPFVLTTWQTDNYLVDNYTAAGYAGAVPQSVDDPNSVTNTISWTPPMLIGQPPPP